MKHFFLILMGIFILQTNPVWGREEDNSIQELRAEQSKRYYGSKSFFSGWGRALSWPFYLFSGKKEPSPVPQQGTSRIRRISDLRSQESSEEPKKPPFGLSEGTIYSIGFLMGTGVSEVFLGDELRSGGERMAVWILRKLEKRGFSPESWGAKKFKKALPWILCHGTSFFLGTLFAWGAGYFFIPREQTRE
jgi:hypothetical protein